MIRDHADAWDLANFRQETSNIARCYIELRQIVRRAVDGDTAAMLELKRIDATSADSTVRAK